MFRNRNVSGEYNKSILLIYTQHCKQYNIIGEMAGLNLVKIAHTVGCNLKKFVTWAQNSIASDSPMAFIWDELTFPSSDFLHLFHRWVKNMQSIHVFSWDISPLKTLWSSL